MLISSLTIVSSLIGKNTGIINYEMIILFKSDHIFIRTLSDIRSQQSTYHFAESSAFVYGAMSFVDKFSCGIVLMLIQKSAETQSENMFFHKYAIVYTCGGASLLGLITIACWYAITLRKRYYHQFQIKSIVKIFVFYLYEEGMP